MIEPSTQPGQTFRVSGHESFACRYAWLPKAYRGLLDDPFLFSREEEAMIELGIGKNMVRSLRFWVEAFGLARTAGRQSGQALRPAAHAIFAEDGYDPYLEHNETLWLLHWALASSTDVPLLAWNMLLGRWSYPEFTRAEALDAMMRESARLGNEHSEATLSQHLDVFLHTYLPSRNGSGVEDSLDGPLTGLELLLQLGQRQSTSGRWEPVYSFRREPKPDISAALFNYCVMDFWARYHSGEDSLPLRTIALAPASPGQLFKLTEDDVRNRIEEGGRSNAGYRYRPSAVQGAVIRDGASVPTLAAIYEREAVHA